jgi:hypothetical protein
MFPQRREGIVHLSDSHSIDIFSAQIKLVQT